MSEGTTVLSNDKWDLRSVAFALPTFDPQKLRVISDHFVTILRIQKLDKLLSKSRRDDLNNIMELKALEMNDAVAQNEYVLVWELADEAAMRGFGKTAQKI